MDEQSKISVVEDVELPDTQYQYIVNVRAVETFANMMSRLGINITYTSKNLSFTAPRLLNMKAMKERGIIFSYSIIRVRTVEDVIEEG